MILVSFFASSTTFGSTKNLLSLPFQAPEFFDLVYVRNNQIYVLTFLRGINDIKMSSHVFLQAIVGAATTATLST